MALTRPWNLPRYGAHRFPVQFPDAQSIGPLVQILPAAHPGQVPPPQSTSVSVPFLTKSVHVEALHTLVMQTPEMQSEAIRQLLVSVHLAHELPPQSMALSDPFWMPSAHVGGRHRFPVQFPDAQSRGPLVHILLSAHLGQVPPPQSTSVSVPFLT